MPVKIDNGIKTDKSYRLLSNAIALVCFVFCSVRHSILYFLTALVKELADFLLATACYGEATRACEL